MNESMNQSINQKLYAMVLCLSVCLSQIGVQSTRLNESACFLVWTLFRPIIHCVIRKFRYLQNKGTSPWDFVPNFGLGIFRHGISIVEECYQLRWTLRA